MLGDFRRVFATNERIGDLSTSQICTMVNLRADDNLAEMMSGRMNMIEPKESARLRVIDSKGTDS
jgi:hypothetical protein